MLDAGFGPQSNYCSNAFGNPEIWETTERLILCAGQNRDTDLLEAALRPLIGQRNIPVLVELGALHWASYLGQISLIEELVGLGVPVNTQDKLYGNTPCHFALQGLQIEAASWLVHFGGSALLHATNFKGRCPFLVTVADASLDKPVRVLRTLEWLLLNGVSIESQDDKGETSLFLAVRRNSSALIQFLLSRGANLGHRDHRGNTVLHIASKDADEEIIPYLCEKGAIVLVPCNSLDGNCFKLLLRNRRYLLWISLWKWYLSHRYIGYIRIFKSPYALYYWLCSITNILLFGMAWISIIDKCPWNIDQWWCILFIITQFWWIIAFLSDPGMVRKNVVPTQIYRLSSSMRETIRKPPPFRARQGTAEYELQSIEMAQIRENYTIFSSANKNSIYKAKHSLTELQATAALLAQRVSEERRSNLSEGYCNAIISSNNTTHSICITCRIVKPLRTHHCTECGHCLTREDHHCVWIDNCIAAQNQRSFWLFLLSLVFYLVINIGFFANYLLQEYFSWYQHISLAALEFDLLKPLTIWIIILTLHIVANIFWLGFASYLLSRTTRSMITNVTFWEYLKKPDHVVKRFKGNVNGYWWDWSDIGPITALKNIIGFWTLSHKLNDVYCKSSNTMTPNHKYAHNQYQLNNPYVAMYT